MWSGHASPSMVSTSISPHSFFYVLDHIFPYCSFLRYFGANTTWYSHRQLECAVWFTSFFIPRKTSLLFRDGGCQTISIVAWRFFCQRLFTCPWFYRGGVLKPKRSKKNPTANYLPSDSPMRLFSSQRYKASPRRRFLPASFPGK